MNWTDVAVSVAQVAAGGGIVQAILAFTRRRSELKQLDRDSDSVAVETADHVIKLLREELDDAKKEIVEIKHGCEEERRDLQGQIRVLGDRIAGLSADLTVARAEINRLQAQRDAP